MYNKIIIYNDGEIAVALIQIDRNDRIQHLAMRWLQPKPCKNADGQLIEPNNLMGRKTDWFIVPFSFAASIGKTLVEQKTAGLNHFNEEGVEESLKLIPAVNYCRIRYQPTCDFVFVLPPNPIPRFHYNQNNLVNTLI